jgi:hypothetical protein
MGNKYALDFCSMKNMLCFVSASAGSFSVRVICAADVNIISESGIVSRVVTMGGPGDQDRPVCGILEDLEYTRRDLRSLGKA